MHCHTACVTLAQAALQQRQQQAAEARATLHAAIAQAAAVAVDSHSGMRLTPSVSRAAVEAAELRAHALEVARLRMLKLQGQLARSMAASTDKVMPRVPVTSTKPCFGYLP